MDHAPRRRHRVRLVERRATGSARRPRRDERGLTCAFVPTIERARSEHIDLPDAEPTTRYALAALVVVAHVMRRVTWYEEKSLDETELGAAERSAPLPPSGTETRHHVYVARVLEEGRPFSRVRLAYVTDRYERLHDTWVPSRVTSHPGLFYFENALEALGGGATPEELRMHDLTGIAESAYRSHRKVEPRFFGHRFEDAIDLARAGLERFLLRGEIERLAVEAYAWPFLWLGYGEENVVLFVGGDGKMHSFVASPRG